MLKELFQNFSDFRGLDVRSSDLTRPLNFAKEVKNFEIEKNFSLGGRRGFKTSSSVFEDEAILGSHNYIYRDPETGEVKEELLALGKTLYRTKQDKSFDIAYTGGTDWGYEFLYDTSIDEYHFKLHENGSQILAYSVGTGLVNKDTGTLKTLNDLATQISGETNFTATCPTELQSHPATAFPLHVNDETFTGTEYLFIDYWEEVPSFADSFPAASEDPFLPYYRRHQEVGFRPPVFSNENNVCYIAMGGDMPLMKYDGSRVYRSGNYPLTKNRFSSMAASTSGSLTGTYAYYVRHVRRDAKGNVVYGTGEIYRDVVLSSQAAGLITSSADYDAYGVFIDPYPGGSWTVSGGGTTLTASGKLTDVHLEAMGHEPLKVGDIVVGYDTSTDRVYGKIVSLDKSIGEIVVDQDFSGLATVDDVRLAYDDWFGVYDFSTTTGTNISALTVNGSLEIQAGEWVFLDNPGEVSEWFRVKSFVGTTLTLEGEVTISSGATDISNISCEIYRTEDGGASKFYRVTEHVSPVLAVSFEDELADTNLGEELILPDDEADYLREYPSLITRHQGIQVAAGFKHRPQRLQYSSIIFLEAYPLATNFYDIPSQEAGLITAVWSDAYDQLAVFKDNAYYSVVGEFTVPIPFLTAEAITENDVGISSQNSLLKIRGLNIGIGKLGVVAFKAGQVDYELTKQLDSEFLVDNIGDTLSEDVKLRVSQATAINDSFNQRAIFFIPARTAVTANGVVTNLRGFNDNSKIFVLDYSESAWKRWKLPETDATELIVGQYLPGGGMTLFQNQLHYISSGYNPSSSATEDEEKYDSYVYRRLQNATTEIKNDYIDQNVSIDYDLQNQWQFGESPLIEKLFTYLKVYTFQTTDFVPFTLRIRTYVNWDTTNVVDNISITVSAGETANLIKLKATRARAMMVRFDVDTIFEKPTITGYELITCEEDDSLEGVR